MFQATRFRRSGVRQLERWEMEETQNNKQRNSASTEPDRIGEKLWLENTRNSGLLEVSSRKVTASSSVQDVVLWAIRGQIRVGSSGLCEETEQKTKTEKLGKGCRTGVRGGNCGWVLLERCDRAVLFEEGYVWVYQGELSVRPGSS